MVFVHYVAFFTRRSPSSVYFSSSLTNIHKSLTCLRILAPTKRNEMIASPSGADLSDVLHSSSPVSPGSSGQQVNSVKVGDVNFVKFSPN